MTTTQNPDALIATLRDIIAVYEWCSVDPVDRGYSALDNEILRAKRLLELSPTTADESAKPSRGTFLGYKNAEGHEMHCANTFCPHQSKCAKGCINQVARPLTPPNGTEP